MIRRLVFTGALLALAGPAWAQNPAPAPPAPAPAPTPFTPSVRVGGQFFGDYFYEFTPKTTDAAGNDVSLSKFEITRVYVNVTGQVTPRISFRITPDIVADTDAGSSINGSLVLRLKFAMAEFSLSPWAGAHTYIRFGLQPTPSWYASEAIYRYRFQGAPFQERDAGMSTSDAGVSFHVDLPDGHGDVHAALFNGEGYNHAEVNNQKAIQVRTTYKPSLSNQWIKGLSLQLVVNTDHYAADLPRHRFLASTFYERHRFNTGLDYLVTRDQPTVTAVDVHGRGYSVWFTPFFRVKGDGPEALVRVDRFRLDAANTSKTRVVAGVAYWFSASAPGKAALLLDYEQTSVDSETVSVETDRRLFVHALVNF